MVLLGAPSFWYVPCAVLWAISGLLWWLRPSIAASFSVFPVLGIAVLIVQSLPNFRNTDYSFRALMICLVVALGFIVASFEWTGTRQLLPLTISFGFVLVAFGADRLFTNKVSIKTFQMGVALEGKAPWGEVGPEWQDGTAPIVLYRRVGTSYCYTAFKSQELHDRIAKEGANSVTVEYNVFSDFGHERSYNVRSVDGVVLTNGKEVIKDAERFGGQILTDGTPAPNCW